jgi:hypothetical protein
MQRWQAESTRDQPYHGIQAVPAEERRYGGGAGAEGRGSSIGYLEPRQKRT